MTTTVNGNRSAEPPALASGSVGASLRRAREVIGPNPLRGRPRVRDWLRRDLLDPADLIAPVLIQPDDRNPAEYAHVPTAFALGRLGEEVRELHRVGVRAIKLFCFVENKTEDAAGALAPNNLLAVGIRTVRDAVPDMVIATEVCGCAWTDHGECVILNGGNRADPDATLELMAEMAVRHAAAGADIIGPAAVLDGSVRAIRGALDADGYAEVGITPSVIFDSTLFATYKNAMGTDPGRGHRRGLQIDGCQLGQALDLAHAWLSEGADSLLIQPAMMAVDVITRLREQTNVPITAFSVSGENRMLSPAGDGVYVEYLRSLRRSGADLVMTYGAGRIADLLTADAAR